MTPVIVVPNDNLYPRFSSFHGHAFTFLLQRGAIQAQYKWDVSQRCMNLSKQGKIKTNGPNLSIPKTIRRFSLRKGSINPRNKGGKQYGFYRSTHGIWHGTCHE